MSYLYRFIMNWQVFHAVLWNACFLVIWKKNGLIMPRGKINQCSCDPVQNYSKYLQLISGALLGQNTASCSNNEYMFILGNY